MTEIQIPDALPVLSAGHHPWGSGRACAMDAASFITGRPEDGDAPRCVHPVLRSAFIRCNDSLPDDKRHELWPLILRALGTADRAPTDELEAKRLNVRLAVWCARHVQHLKSHRAVCEAAVVAAERWCEEPTEANKKAASDASVAYDAFASASDASVAYDAYAYASAAVASAYDAYADARLASLTALLNEYDRLCPPITQPADIPWTDLTDALGATR